MKSQSPSFFVPAINLLIASVLLLGIPAAADNDLAKWQKGAEAGDSESQFQLGVRYEMGNGVPKDPSKALALFQKSAAQGNAHGEMFLGQCYMAGMGVTRDMAKGQEWLSKAAKQGDEAAVGTLSALNVQAVESAPASASDDAPKSAQASATPADVTAPIATAEPDVDINAVTTYQPESILIQRKDATDPKIAGTIGYYLLQGISTKKNKDEATKWIKTAADKGDPFALGLQAQYALGQPKDVPKALAFYQDAAAKGNDLAVSHLGYIYNAAEDVPRDQKQAQNWLEKGAELGNALAEADLATLYADPSEKKYDLVHSWARKSALQGSDIGESKLGSCYVLGLGVDTDYGIAIYWLNKAIAQGNHAAIENTAKLKAWMISVGKDTTPADAATAQDIVATSTAPADDARLSSCQTLPQLLKRSDLHDPRVSGVVGYYYLCGIGAAKDDPKEGAKWVSDAAAHGDPFAQVLQYQYGIGVAKDPAKAAALVQPIAEKGDDIAQVVMGFYYESGTGVTKDLIEAYNWYEKAALQGNSYAAAHLGEMYFFGNGVNHDDGQAIAWFKQSAGEGNPLGECHLGECYAHGVGVKQDYEMAIRWLKKSAAQGQGEEVLKQVRYAEAHPEPATLQGHAIDARRLIIGLAIDALVAGILDDDSGPSPSDNARFSEAQREIHNSDMQQQAYMQRQAPHD